jgi:hypothetical protein
MLKAAKLRKHGYFGDRRNRWPDPGFTYYADAPEGTIEVGWFTYGMAMPTWEALNRCEAALSPHFAVERIAENGGRLIVREKEEAT